MGFAKRLAAVIIVAATVLPAAATAETVPFDSDRWMKQGARVEEHLGRDALTGTAFLPDADFGDGVIEFDIAVTGERGYPGVVFHAKDMRNYEHLYIRPHRMGLYPDALQYAPTINGISGWQLCNGEGCTSPIDLPIDEWVRLRLEVAGSRARLFIGDAVEPALVMDRLRLGESRGGIGVRSAGGEAWFSNISFSSGDLAFDAAPPVYAPPGLIADWEISRAFPLGDVDPEEYPGDSGIEMGWRPVGPEPDGLVDISRLQGRTSREPDVVYARTTIKADAPGTMHLDFGYSDAVVVFLNGRKLFSGASAYRQRDPSFLGIVGLFDTVYLPLEAGENELMLLVAESFGGWGFIARDAKAVFAAPGAREEWRTPPAFDAPETVVADEDRGVLYVSNYDMYRPGTADQAISTVSFDGEVLDARWIEGLSNPVGLAVSGDRLWAVERAALVEIGIGNRTIVARHPFPGPGFPNDVAVDEAGNVYVTDSRRNAIYRFAGGEMDVWLSGEAISAPNGICAAGGEVFWTNNGDRRVKAARIDGGEVRTVARFGAAGMDGIERDGDGGLLVSQYEGRLFRVSPDGRIEKVLDTTAVGENIANFAFSPKRRLVVAPVMGDGRVVAWRLP